MPHPSTPMPVSATEHALTVPLSTTVPTTPRPKTTKSFISRADMSSGFTPEQVAEQALREKAELEAQVKYLQSQLGQLLQEKRRNLRSSRSAGK